MTTFVVAGDATITHQAERAIVRVSVALTSTDRAAASQAAIEAHNVVASEAATFHARGAATWWQADQVTTWSYDEHAQGVESPTKRYRAESHLSVTFQDFEAVSTWVTRLSEWPSVRVDGIDWALTIATRESLEAQARVAAMKDATDRATHYAAALDLAAPTLVTLFEEGLRPGSGGAAPFARSALAMKTAAFTDGALDLKPGDIEVTARVSADFTVQLRP